jgi:hypothetical protein
MHQSDSKETLKKRDILNKEDNTRYKRGVEQRFGKPQKRELNRNPVSKEFPLVKKKFS